MKLFATIFLSVALSSGQAYAMTMVETPNSGSGTPATGQPEQGGKVDAIHAGASKMVIGGVTYAYNPLTTIVTVNGKRATISDVRRGETVQFQAASQGADKAPLLTAISVQRQ